MFSSELRKVLIYAAFWSLVIIAFYFLFWRVSIAELKEESKKIEQIEMALNQTKSYIDDWPIAFEKDLQKAEEDLEDFIERIPHQEEIPDVLEEIHQSKLNIISVENTTQKQEFEEETEEQISSLLKSQGLLKSQEKEQEKKKEEKKYAKSTYKMMATGKYPDVVEFLRNLETTERLVNVEDFELNSSTDGDGSIDLDLTFSIFYSKSKEENETN